MPKIVAPLKKAYLQDKKLRQKQKDHVKWVCTKGTGPQRPVQRGLGTKKGKSFYFELG